MYSSIKSPYMMLTLTLSVYVFSVCCVVAVQQSGDVGTEDSHTMYSTPPETASSRESRERYLTKAGLNINENIKAMDFGYSVCNALLPLLQ